MVKIHGFDASMITSGKTSKVVCDVTSGTGSSATERNMALREIEEVWQKVEDQQREVHMNCITEHSVFQSTCLDVWELETAYYLCVQCGHPQQDKYLCSYMVTTNSLHLEPLRDKIVITSRRCLARKYILFTRLFTIFVYNFSAINYL